MNGTFFWLPLEMKVEWVLFVLGLASFLVSQYWPFYRVLWCTCRLHSNVVYNHLHCFSTTIVYPPCTSPPTVYTQEQLLSMKPSPLHPDLTSCLHHLWIGFNLPWFRGCRWGRRKHKKIDIIVCTSDCTWRTKASGVDFTNLISVPFSSERPTTKRNCKIIVTVAVSQWDCWERKASAQPSIILSWITKSMSCALRKPGFYPAVMKPSIATCHPLASGL